MSIELLQQKIERPTLQEESVIDEEVVTPYTRRLVTTFEGPITPAPLLTLSDEEAVKNYASRFRDNIKKAHNLFRNPDNELALQLEYQELNAKYSIDKYTRELPICIVAPGRNFLKTGMYVHLFESINNQNYSNYRLFLTDDASTDGSYLALKKKIQEFPRLRARATLIKNYEHVGALGNKYLTVTQHCGEGSIVFDIDADDSLIGRQSMKLMNALYQSTSNWFIYSNFIYEEHK